MRWPRTAESLDDDAIAIKTSGNSKLLRNVERIAMRGCTILTKKSAMKLGTETRAEALRDIVFADNDVIEASRAMSLYCYDGALFEHIRFERNRLERIFTPEKQQRVLMFQVKHRDGAHAGIIRDVLIADTISEVDSPDPSIIEGFDAEHGISDVRFFNCTVGGRICRNAADARLELNQYTANVTFAVDSERSAKLNNTPMQAEAKQDRANGQEGVNQNSHLSK
jgi:hypothetical protein